MTPTPPQKEYIVYSKTIAVPAKAFPSIKRRKLALNDIGDNDDGFTRLNFELQDGDTIQVIRSNPSPPQPQQDELNPSYPVTWEELRNIYADGLSLDKYDEILLRKTCSNPAPSPQPTGSYRCCEVCQNVPCKPTFKTNCSNKSEDCPHWVSSANLKSDFRDQDIGRYYCNKSMYDHDTAIRNATLDDVIQYAVTCIWIDDDCRHMNDKEDSDCDGCSYVDYPNNADICEKIISLRTQPQEPKL